MTNFTNKIDFAVLFTVKKANPNGDPLSGNRPREDYNGFGEVSDVCIKRKIRNRLQDMEQNIFVQSDERTDDGCRSLSERVKKSEDLLEAAKKKDSVVFAKLACEKWMDVRSFGQVFAFKDNSVSIGVRGPVSIRFAESIDPISSSSLQITKSVNSETSDKRSSDTMGMKHIVNFGLYVFKGSINHQLAEKTGFTNEDAELIKQSLITLFMNDASSARPEGSMEVCKVYWWEHNCKSGQYSTAKVHRSLTIKPLKELGEARDFNDFEITLEPLEGLEPEIYDGI